MKKAKAKAKPKQKPLEKRIVRLKYNYVIVRACLDTQVGAKAADLKNLTSVRLIAALFQTTPLRVAKDMAFLNHNVAALFEQEKLKRKAKK